MKKLFVLTLVMALFATMASAELLVTANPIGKGKWAALGAFLSDSGLQFGGLTGLTAQTIGAYGGYGINEKLDLYLQVGQVTIGSLPVAPGVPTGIKTLGYGLNLKYAVLEESSSMPVSVALGGGYKILSQDMTSALGTANTGGNQWGVGAIVSKIMVPFIPYGGLTYKSTAYAGTTTMSQIDITVGSAIAWSTQGAVFVEYTSQAITPTGVGGYTSGQIAGGVGYKI